MREGMRGKLQPLTLADIKAMDIVEYLHKVGHQPVRIRNADHWYLSPLRAEKTASFKVNQKLNRWYDHGIGKGGNLVDFAVEFYQCPVRQVIEIFSGDFFVHQPRAQQVPKIHVGADYSVQILDVKTITSAALLQYLLERRISRKVAREYCQQVSYKIAERQFFALGFRNDSGGFELRNSFSKVSSKPKDITSINAGGKIVSVFEGFFDFLSYKTFQLPTHNKAENHVILNSISLFDRALNFLDGHDHINLYLDRDEAGRRCLAAAMDINEKYNDASILYEGFKDLNEWLVNSF